MEIKSLSSYWGGQKFHKKEGIWAHPEDVELLSSMPHSFNLDYPAPAFVGNILRAKTIILSANGGYRKERTPKEFQQKGSISNYIYRLENPATADWSDVASYYKKLNYAKLIQKGQAALVNACAYRSPQISKEPENKKLIKQLPSVKFSKRWLAESIFPLVEQGRCLVVAKRWGLWGLRRDEHSKHVTFEDAPVSPFLSDKSMEKIGRFLKEY